MDQRYFQKGLGFRAEVRPQLHENYRSEIVDFMRANVYDNTTRMNTPPWCGNRDPDMDFMPRYWFYPRDPLYKDLFWEAAPVDPYLDF